MNENRTKNAVRNIVFGVLNKIVTLFLPFLARTIVLYLLGTSFLGIGTLFSSVLNFLSLAELGLSSAIVYAMYKPIAENDTAFVGALLHFYRKLYRYIGCVILIIGTALIPAIPFLIKSGAPEGINIYLLYYIYLLNSVISYFFAGYRQSLLSAHQRTDIINNIATLISLFVQFGQILALYYTRNFYVYAFVPLLGTILTNCITAVLTRKKYPEIICEGDVPEEVKHEIAAKISGLLGTKLNSIVVHSSDTLIISSFLGLAMTAIYGNYYYIMNAVCGFIMIIYSSITAGIGNKLVTDSLEENYVLFKNLSFINEWLVGVCSTCFICLYEPFMELWVGEDMMLGFPFAVLMAFYFYIYMVQRTILTFKDASGLWEKDRTRPYVSMILNVVCNLILVQIIGIYGIVLSTILAFAVSLPWVNYVLFKYLFKKSPSLNLLRILSLFVLMLIISAITYALCFICHNGILGLIERMLISCIVPNTIYIILFSRRSEFIFLKEKIGILKRK